MHEVIAAMTTAPWSTSVSVPSSSVTAVGRDARSSAPVAAESTCGVPEPLPLSTAIGSEAGKVPATPASTSDSTPSEPA